MRKLKVLRLDNNRLSKIDYREIGCCSQVTVLDISCNDIHDISVSFLHLVLVADFEVQLPVNSFVFPLQLITVVEWISLPESFSDWLILIHSFCLSAQKKKILVDNIIHVQKSWHVEF